MTITRHEIPTHLHVVDRALLGLSMRQLTLLLSGATVAFGVWNAWPALPPVLRAGMAILAALTAGALAVVRPHGRSLEDWLFVGGRYLVAPRKARWRVREPQPDRWRAHPGGWEESDPRLTWPRRGAA